MIGYNFHMHTHFSDGHHPPEDYIIAALEQDMKAIGFSDHSPLPFDNPFSLPSNRLQEYKEEILSLKKKYADKIDIFLSLEMDYVPKMSADFKPLADEAALDYVIGSVHLVGSEIPENLWFTDGPDRSIYDDGLAKFYQNDIRKAVKAFYHQTNEMISTQEFDVIGHFDKIKMHNQDRYFTEDEAWYKQLVMETLALIREKGLIVEVNTRGIYKKRSQSLYPSDWILRQMHLWKIPAIISSDAHMPNEIQMAMEEAVLALIQAGYKEVMRFDGTGWLPMPVPYIH